MHARAPRNVCIAVQALRACRIAANQIHDVQLQQESMGFIAELLSPLEAQLAAPHRHAQANGEATTGARDLEQLLLDVQDLQQQLQEWAGVVSQ